MAANETILSQGELVFGIISRNFLWNLISFIALLAAGFIIGKAIKIFLKGILEKSGVRERHYFYNLFLSIIEWSIYILFLNFALIQLNIPEITNWITSVLFVIPALTGALLLITVGFVISTYLKDIIEDSKIQGYEYLSKIFFFFVLYVFLVFAFKTALISLDKNTSNILLIALSIIVGIAVAYHQAFKKK